jgi:uncharacterized DUF497 family protein
VYILETCGYEWDPKKNSANIRKHGIDFQDAISIFDGPYIEGSDNRFDYGEDRMIAYGSMSSHVVAVVFTWRTNKRRILSARKATRSETLAYFKEAYGGT